MIWEKAAESNFSNIRMVKSIEEINFYESFESNADSIFALLYVVFSILKDEQRVEFYHDRINVVRINSKYINAFFLEELIKRKEYEKIEELIFKNSINIESRKASISSFE